MKLLKHEKSGNRQVSMRYKHCLVRYYERYSAFAKHAVPDEYVCLCMVVNVIQWAMLCIFFSNYLFMILLLEEFFWQTKLIKEKLWDSLLFKWKRQQVCFLIEFVECTKSSLLGAQLQSLLTMRAFWDNWFWRIRSDNTHLEGKCSKMYYLYHTSLRNKQL